MSQHPPTRPLRWLEPGEPFPSVDAAWGPQDPAPGLLAAGGVLDVPTLVNAYSLGIFPWYSAGQPILWWSTDPRMVLETRSFRLHHSLRKSLKKLLREERLEIRLDHDFERVIRACAQSPRQGQDGTWILPAMVQAYTKLHQAGIAHSVEAWIDDELAGGLYTVNLGAMVFGESMFARRTDASKMALAALVAFCRHQGIPMIDCQQETSHLTSMGGHTIPRSDFQRHVRAAIQHTAPQWHFSPLYWRTVIDDVAAT